MNENTRNAFASYGLEILKRSVLLVLYQVKPIFALFSKYQIGDTGGSVPALLFPNTFAP